MIIGLQTIRACISNGTSPPYPFTGGYYNFGSEVEDLMVRMIDYIHYPTETNFPSDWFIKDPENNKVNRGWNCWALAPGFSSAYKKIVGRNNPKLYLRTPDWKVAVLAYNSALYTPFIYLTAEGQKMLNLAVAGNTFTSWRLFERCYLMGGQEWVYMQIPLLNKLINGGIDFKDEEYYRNLLNSAPCYGPYNHNNGIYHTWNWSSPSLIVHPEHRGANYLFNAGDFNGLDYLLMYSLFSINARLTDFISWSDKEIHYTYPYLNQGDDSNPYYANAIERIDADNIIRPDGNVTYRAGVEINLNPGMDVQYGSDFYAYIDPPEYCRVASRVASNNNVSNITKGEVIDWTGGKVKESTAEVFPNPFNNNIVLKIFSEHTREITVELSSILGKTELVKNGVVVSDGVSFIELDLTHLSTGIYNCMIKTKDKIECIKIVKAN